MRARPPPARPKERANRRPRGAALICSLVRQDLPVDPWDRVISLGPVCP